MPVGEPLEILRSAVIRWLERISVGECGMHKKDGNTLVINGIPYRVEESLSLPDRRRWRICDMRQGAERHRYTLIELANTPDAAQFLASVKKLPRHVRGIPRYFDSDTTPAKIRILVDWIEGTTLQHYFEYFQGGAYLPISAYETVRLARGLAFLCNALHRKFRIIHADLKPENLVLHSKHSTLSIIDYGSSWPIEQTSVRHAGDGFDPHYAAPELFSNSSVVDGRVDQFSIGVIMYRMLTGKIPYDGLGGLAGNTRRSISEMESVFVLPSHDSGVMQNLPNSIRDTIDALVMRTLRLSYRDRFATTQQFYSELDSIYDTLKVSRRTYSQLKREMPNHSDSSWIEWIRSHFKFE